MEKLSIVLLLSSVLFISTFTNAGVYKWTDKEGNVHYGDQPITKQNTTELNINTKSDSGVAINSDKKKERDRVLQEFQEDREERKEKRDAQRAKKAKLNKQCARAKDRLRRYREASAVYKLDKNGERIFYSKKQRARNEKAINKAISKHCR